MRNDHKAVDCHEQFEFLSPLVGRDLWITYIIKRRPCITTRIERITTTKRLLKLLRKRPTGLAYCLNWSNASLGFHRVPGSSHDYH